MYNVACSGSRANTVQQHTASSPSAIVSGAGTAAANGTWTYRGVDTGRPFYCPLGSPTVNPGDPGSVMRWADGWILDGELVSSLYVSNDDVAFPWLATWSADNGDPPAPTVTHS